MFRTLSALASLVAASTALVPTASNAQDSTSVLVPYSDLNLASAGGQDRLERRMILCSQECVRRRRHVHRPWLSYSILPDGRGR